MTIRESLLEYLGDSASGDTIAEVLRTGLSADGGTIGEVVADAAASSASSGSGSGGGA